ncbi:MAG TPA: DUF3309 family protein [Anaerolineales bacterium]
MSPILLILLVVLLLAALPVWPYSRRWGYGGTGILGFILFLLVIAWLLGYLR